jgi:photosystem II stability/assembly factor-like uncharacterized protein
MEHLLLEELTRLDARPVRPVDDALAAVARRRARRTGGAVGAAGLAVVAVLGVTVAMVNGGARGPEAPPSTVGADAGWEFSGPAPEAVFVSADHGFLLLERCDDKGWPCKMIIAATDDGGHTFSAHDVPATSADGPAVFGAFDSRTLVYLPSTYERDVAFRSKDAGQTWEPIQPEPTFDTVPAGGRIANVGSDKVGVQTADGGFGWLRVRPSAGFGLSAVEAAADGTIIALGERRTDPPADKPNLAPGTAEVWVSHDGAATWQPRFPPSARLRQIPAMAYLDIVDADRMCIRNGWLGEGADFPDSEQEAWLMRCSEDGGASWRQLDLDWESPAGPGEPSDVGGFFQAALLTDGGVVITTDKGLAQVDPGSTTPTRLDDRAEMLTPVRGGGAVLVMQRPDGLPGSPQVTRDGRTWLPVRL